MWHARAEPEQRQGDEEADDAPSEACAPIGAQAAQPPERRPGRRPPLVDQLRRRRSERATLERHGRRCVTVRTDAIRVDDVGVLLRLLTPTNALVMETCFATGLRVSDVLAMRTDKLKQRMSVKEHKTGKTRRVYLGKGLYDRLKRQAGAVWVFPGASDPVRRHRCRQTVWKDVKRAAKALRLDYNAAPHSARKSYACDLYRREGLAAVQKALQHDNVNTTLIYLASELLH